jgi:hypothetical protein
MSEININGEIYVKKSDLPEIVSGNYVVVRTYSAGVHAGFLESQNGKEVVLRNTRRLWHWKGAASLSQIAGAGISEPNECKFPAPIDKIILTEAIEIIPCTEKAREIIQAVPAWEK